MTAFHSNSSLQLKVNIVCNEGRMQDLVFASDFYHGAFPSHEHCFEWSFNFGEFVGKYAFGQGIWRFCLPNGGYVYFVGDLKDIQSKIDKVL